MTKKAEITAFMVIFTTHEKIGELAGGDSGEKRPSGLRFLFSAAGGWREMAQMCKQNRQIEYRYFVNVMQETHKKFSIKANGAMYRGKKTRDVWKWAPVFGNL
ncbi:MAG: hypothetical protein HFG25_05100 [Lachnospiraceae bacterium]|jgi:hypothetical protein|nr:hypothetical protein [Lachnospiraceae bacterium]